MRVLVACAIAGILGGCAHMGKPNAPPPVIRAPIVRPHVLKPVVVTPAKPATFKSRWYDKFRTHRKWFH